MRRLFLSIILAGVVLVQLALPATREKPAASQEQANGDLQSPPSELKLPLKPDSVRFAVIGDSGTGDQKQYEVAQQMAVYHEKFPFDSVIMLGDNIYGGHSPSDFEKKFERPYKTLLDAGVKFYASLGNHDNPNERFYEPFNMGGERYYTFRKANVAFFALDGNYMSPKQLNWLQQLLEKANSAWKICFFHQPLYSDGKFHGPDIDLRAHLEPLFERYGVDAVFSGHEHLYERIKPQNGIYYFVLGNSGELRSHNLRPSADTVKGFDTDRDFMLVEVAGGELYFQTISRKGQTVDFDRLIKPRIKSNGSVIPKLDIPEPAGSGSRRSGDATLPAAAYADFTPKRISRANAF